MKFLIVAGAPRTQIPGLGIEIRATTHRFSLDTSEVIKRIVEDDEKHELTLLRLDFDAPDSIHGVERTIVASDMDDLIAKFDYLAAEVKYDAIVSLLQLPVYSYTGAYASYNDLEGESALLHRVSDELTTFDSDPLLRFRLREDEAMDRWTRHVYATRDRGSEASVICLETINRIANDVKPWPIINDRHERIKEFCAGIAILDDIEVEEDRRGAYVIARSGIVPVRANRLIEHASAGIIEAAKIVAEQREAD